VKGFHIKKEADEKEKESRPKKPHTIPKSKAQRKGRKRAAGVRAII
jgi:hypothetical protein